VVERREGFKYIVKNESSGEELKTKYRPTELLLARSESQSQKKRKIGIAEQIATEKASKKRKLLDLVGSEIVDE
jgi:hypothetical protein